MANRSKRGFTLIELLTVIVIIGILIGIVIGVGGTVRKKAAAARAKAEISGFEMALQRYKDDNGLYPNWAGIAESGGVYTGMPGTYQAQLIDTSAPVGQRSLFEQLAGRRKFSDENATGTQYIKLKENQTGSTTQDSYLVDPFGFAYGYKYDAAASSGAKSLFNQVEPDIWSTAGQNLDTSLDTASDVHYIYLRWVTNWGSR